MISSDEPARTDLLCGRRKEYQQELAKRGFGTVLQKKVWYLTTDSKKSSKYWKYIAQPSVVSLPKKVLIMSASNGGPSGQSLFRCDAR